MSSRQFVHVFLARKMKSVHKQKKSRAKKKPRITLKSKVQSFISDFESAMEEEPDFQVVLQDLRCYELFQNFKRSMSW